MWSPFRSPGLVKIRAATTPSRPPQFWGQSVGQSGHFMIATTPGAVHRGFTATPFDLRTIIEGCGETRLWGAMHGG